MAEKYPKTIKENGIIYSADGKIALGVNRTFSDNVIKIKEGTEIIGENFSYYKQELMADEVILPKSVKQISANAFQNVKIKKINLENVKNIGKCAFYGSFLSHVTINKETIVSDRAFSDCLKLETVNYGPSEIPDYAFANCRKLYNFNADNIVKINANAFRNCDSLKEFPFKEGLKEIGMSSFAGSDINSVHVPSTVEHIHSFAFANSKLSDITFEPSEDKDRKLVLGEGCLENTKMATLFIPSFVTEIHKGAFRKNDLLATLNIQAEIDTLPEEVASSCKNLTSLTLSNKIKIIEDCAFYKTGLVELTSELDNIEKIGFGAFADCENLKFVYISHNCKFIDTACFADCKNLDIAVLLNEDIGDGIFKYASQAMKIFAPFINLSRFDTGPDQKSDNVINNKEMLSQDLLEYFPFKKVSRILSNTLYEEDDVYYKNSSKEILYYVKNPPPLPPSKFFVCPNVKVIKSNAFSNFNQPDMDICIPSSVELIEPSAFQNCVAKNINFEEGFKKINNSAFKFSIIESATLPLSLKEIEDYAFLGSSITKITLSEVEKFGNYCFKDTNLVAIPAFNENAKFGKDVFADCKELVDVICNVKGEMPTFSGCNNLSSILIGPNIKKIPDNCFEGCEKLFNVIFNEGLEEIGKEAFCGTAITSVKLPNTIEIINEQAFSACNKLETFILPPDGKNIKIYGDILAGTAVKSLVVPYSVSSIEDYAFSFMPVLESVEYSPKVNYVPASCFTNCSLLKDVILSDNISIIGSYAFDRTGIREVSDNFKNVKNFECSAFIDCRKLRNVFIGENAILSNGVFSRCHGLKSAIILTNDVAEDIFCDCKNVNIFIDEEIKKELIMTPGTKGLVKTASIKEIDEDFLEKVKNILGPARLGILQER